MPFTWDDEQYSISGEVQSYSTTSTNTSGGFTWDDTPVTEPVSESDHWWDSLGTDFYHAVQPMVDLATLGSSHWPNLLSTPYTAVHDFITDPFGVTSAGQEEQIANLRQQQMPEPVITPNATGQSYGLMDTDQLTTLMPQKDAPFTQDPRNLEVMKANEWAKKTALSADADAFALPYSVSEDRLNQPILSGTSQTEKGFDAISIPQQAMIGAMISEPNPSDPFGGLLTGAEQGIRANVSGRELIEFLTERKLPQMTWDNMVVDPVGTMGAQTAAIGMTVLADPLNLIPGKVYTKGFELVTEALRPIGTAARGLVDAKIPYLSRGLEETANAFSKVGFRSSMERSVMDILDESARQKAFSLINIFGDETKMQAVVDDVAKQTSMKPEYIKKMLNDVIETKFEPIPQTTPAAPKITFKTLSDESDAFQKRIDDLESYLDSKGMSFADIQSNSQVTDLYNQRIAVDTQAAQYAYDGVKNVLKNTIGDLPDKSLYASWDSILRERYALSQNPSTGSYMFSKYTGQAVNNPETVKKLAEDVSKLLVEKKYPGTDFFDLMDNPNSAIGMPEKEAIAKEAIDRAIQINKQVENFLVNDSYDLSSLAEQLKNGTVSEQTISQLPKSKLDLLAGIKDRMSYGVPANERFGISLGEERFEVDMNELQQLMKAMPEEETALIQAKLRSAGVQVPDDVAKLGTHLKAIRNEKWLQAQQAGILTPELADVTLDYLLHYRTKEAMEKMAALSPDFSITKGGRLVNPTHASQRMREIRELGVNKLNELGRQSAIPGLEGTYFSKFLEDDPIKLEAFRQIRDASAIADLNAVMKSRSLAAGKEMKSAGWRQLSLINNDNPALKQIKEILKDDYYHPDVAKHLDKVYAFTFDPSAESKFFELYDTVKSTWSSLTLNVSPSTVARNLASSVLNFSLGGTYNPKWYEFSKDFLSGTMRGVTMNGKHWDPKKLASALKDTGVLGGGYATVETRGRTMKEFQRGFDIANAPVIGKVITKGRHVNRMAEDWGRIAHFMDRVDKGDDIWEAAKSVKKYGFDGMTDLTEFEAKWGRRVFPFYHWTRKNLPLQIIGNIQNPTPLIRLSELVNYSKDQELAARQNSIYNKMTPEYVANQVGIPFRESEDGLGEFFILGGWHPVADLEILLSGNAAYDKMLQSVSPIIKEVAEQMTGQDLFLKRPIETPPGELQRFVNIDMRKRAVHLLRNLRILSDFDRMMSGYYDDKIQLSKTQKSTASKAMQWFTGLSTQKVDYRVQAGLRQSRFNDLIKLYNSAAGKGDQKNMQVLMEQIEEYWK